MKADEKRMKEDGRKEREKYAVRYVMKRECA